MSVPLGAALGGGVPAIPFWPNFVHREDGGLAPPLGLLVTIPPSCPGLGPSADLMAPTPEGVKPEWYFLFLFQTLKIFPANIGPVTGDIVAVVVILLSPSCHLLPALPRGEAARETGQARHLRRYPRRHLCDRHEHLEPVMRKLAIGILLVTVSLAPAPLAAFAGQAGDAADGHGKSPDRSRPVFG